ncbi:hypothetical protein D6779_07340 [Candidatus Parcubacteria bacterium]|nr:MAG: hypothetical protein D6779_07340 [Candidatus Parcubacteria bacterium]
MSHPLQNILLAPRVVADEALYFRGKGGYVAEPETLRLEKGADIDFFSWYGLFNLETWRTYTACEQFFLRGKASGRVIIELWHHTGPHQRYRLASLLHESEATEVFTLAVPDGIHSGLLSVRVKALGDASICQLCWEGTAPQPPKPVRLGLVMTTFNRQSAALASAQRISAFIASIQEQLSPDEAVALAVVDNGRNLDLPELPGVVHIPNPNLGGSGGFARGLYYFKEERGFSHCLFMDDDAACETESIWRTLQLLCFSIVDDLAIAGTLFAQSPPWLQIERGALFRYHCVGLGHGRDLRSVRQLFKNEKSRLFDYGGWWFFAFPVSGVDYPFPFFVRGDDVHFGLHNHLTKITLAGVSTWGEDFTAKESPMTRYLDMRHHLMQYLLSKQLKANPLVWVRLILPSVLRSVLTMRYAAAEAQLLAIEHVLQGPRFWEANPALESVWNVLRPLNEEEKPQQIPPVLEKQQISSESRSRKVWWRRLYKVMTLNGHLLPRRAWKHEPVRIDKASFELEAFLPYACVYLVTPYAEGGIRLCKDRRRFFSIVWRMLGLTGKILYSSASLQKAYRSAAPRLMSRAFWEQQFGLSAGTNRDEG